MFFSLFLFSLFIPSKCDPIEKNSMRELVSCLPPTFLQLIPILNILFEQKKKHETFPFSFSSNSNWSWQTCKENLMNQTSAGSFPSIESLHTGKENGRNKTKKREWIVCGDDGKFNTSAELTKIQNKNWDTQKQSFFPFSVCLVALKIAH